MSTGILLLIKGLGRGGAEQLLADAAPRFDTVRFRYEVGYLLPWKDALVGDLESAGLPVHCVRGGRGASWILRLRRLVRERGIQLVHSHSPFSGIGARIALPGIRMVCTEHNVWDRYHRATYWGNVLTFARNDHVFAVSDEVRASVRYPRGLRFLHVPPVETLYHGVNVDRVRSWEGVGGVREELGIPDGARVVGTVGNLLPKKAHGELIEAAAQVRRSVPDVRVVLVGLGPLENELRERARRLGLEERVVFAGFRTDAPRVAAAFDVFVLASRYEGLPVALLEAMTLGRPVVATRVGGVAEVVEEGRSGILVPPGDPPALAEAVTRVLGDPALAARLGAEARLRAARFDIGVAVGRMEEVYGALVR